MTKDYGFDHFCHQQAKRIYAQFNNREVKRATAKERKQAEEAEEHGRWLIRGIVSGWIPRSQ